MSHFSSVGLAKPDDDGNSPVAEVVERSLGPLDRVPDPGRDHFDPEAVTRELLAVEFDLDLGGADSEAGLDIGEFGHGDHDLGHSLRHPPQIEQIVAVDLDLNRGAEAEEHRPDHPGLEIGNLVEPAAYPLQYLDLDRRFRVGRG